MVKTEVIEAPKGFNVTWVSVAITIAVIGGGGLMSFANLKTEAAEHERRLQLLENQIMQMQIMEQETHNDVKWLRQINERAVK